MRLIDAEQFDFFGGSYKGYDRESYIAGAKAVLEKMDEAPTIDAEPVVHAYWKRKGAFLFVCSNCGRSPLLNGAEEEELSPYCPHCGAKMDGKEGKHDKA